MTNTLHQLPGCLPLRGNHPATVRWATPSKTSKRLKKITFSGHHPPDCPLIISHGVPLCLCRREGAAPQQHPLTLRGSSMPGGSPETPDPNPPSPGAAQQGSGAGLGGGWVPRRALGLNFLVLGQAGTGLALTKQRSPGLGGLDTDSGTTVCWVYC